MVITLKEKAAFLAKDRTTFSQVVTMVNTTACIFRIIGGEGSRTPVRNSRNVNVYLTFPVFHFSGCKESRKTFAANRTFVAASEGVRNLLAAGKLGPHALSRSSGNLRPAK